MAKLIPIERVHRVTLYLTGKASVEKEEQLAEFALRYSTNSLDVTSTAGGPCWSAYIVAEGSDLDEVTFFRDIVVNEAKRLRIGLMQ